MSRQLTVRGVPDEVAERLERLSRARGQSVNRTVNQILGEAVGSDARRRALDRYATWTQRDLAEVTEAVAAQRTIDDALWR
jgi:plasmid stability protein